MSVDEKQKRNIYKKKSMEHNIKIKINRITVVLKYLCTKETKKN